MKAAVLERAEELAAELAAPKIKVTTDAAKVQSLAPCLLVVPVPAIEFETFGDDMTVSWTIVALGAQRPDLVTAGILLELVEHVASVLPIEEARPDAWSITATADLPAYVMKHSEVIAP